MINFRKVHIQQRGKDMRTFAVFPMQNRPGVMSRERLILLLRIAVGNITLVEYNRGLRISVGNSQIAVVLKIVYRRDVMWYTVDDDLERDFFADFF